MRHLLWSIFLAGQLNFIGQSGRVVPVGQYRVTLCWHTSTAQRIPTVRFKMATIQTVDDICDIDELSHVINFELPNVPETYVHRIGRTGRAGAAGIALSFCDQEEMAFLKDIQKLIAKTIPVVEDQPYHMRGAAYIQALPPKKKTADNKPSNSKKRSGSKRRFIKK